MMLIVGLASQLVFSQSINPQYVYWLNNEIIYELDPVTNKSHEFSLKMPMGSTGLTIASNPRMPETLTFYTTVMSLIYYYDGKKWVSTNHFSYVNLGGGKKYVYILDGVGSKVYRYDGNEEIQLVLSLDPNFCGPYDIVADTQDHFYLLHNKLKKLVEYDPGGKVIREIPLTGLKDEVSGGGFAMVNGYVYANVSGRSVVGQLKDGVIEFSDASYLPSSLNDFATVPYKHDLMVSNPSTNAPSNSNIRIPLNLRPVELQHTISVDQNKLRLSVWLPSTDHRSRVSFIFNGVKILDNTLLSDTKVEFDLTVSSQGDNHLSMELMNENKGIAIAANVSVMVNGQEQLVSLTSDYKKSGAINLVLHSR